MKTNQIPPDAKHHLRTFAYWLANGTVGMPTLEGVDYKCIFEEPSALEQAMAIYTNILKWDEDGVVINAKFAEKRAAEYIRSYCNPDYRMDPELSEEEQYLH